MREDEGLVQVDGALVILGGLAELGLDEVQLGAVVEDVRVVGVVLDGKLEVMGGLVTLGLLEVHAGALDVRLNKARVELKRLVKVGESRVTVAS